MALDRITRDVAQNNLNQRSKPHGEFNRKINRRRSENTT